MASRKNPGIPDGLTAKAREARQEFLEIYLRFLEEAKNEVALKILVWGPNPGARSPAAIKRVEIRDELVKLGHYATFSEDLAFPDADAGLSEKTKEHAQARAADLVIVLIEGAPGATAEVHDFGGDLAICHKLQIMVPKKYRRGYSAQGAIQDLQNATGGGCVSWYRDADLAKCSVLSEAVKRAEAMRNMIFRQKKGASR